VPPPGLLLDAALPPLGTGLLIGKLPVTAVMTIEALNRLWMGVCGDTSGSR
jgi:hypothetical protein